ncbi:MAG: TIGR02221 family CRISPR-associated protein [Treponema sp.]|nr:TIGR02221 family CRISPR-associated protein [Treponema sp.]
MKGFTLISCIGTGMYKSGYRQTKYQFPNKGKECETSFFLKAILETGYRPIQKVILVGTRTSSWDVLIPNASGDENIDFWETVLKECENKENGISDESIAELESRLPAWYDGVLFKLAIHSHELTPENVEKIFSTYIDIPNELAPETDILFDITHGFRSMPLLIFQSLQLNAPKIKGSKVELIYGEYIDEEKISYVRDLSQYWGFYEITSAIKLFDEKLDGKLLADKVMPDWESGAKILFRLSEIVEDNLSLEMPEALKQLKNALKDFNEVGKSQWLIDVKNKLDEIYNRLNVDKNEKYPIAKSVWEYSKLLREKNLITQAVIALHVVVETAIAEKYDPEKIGDYCWFKWIF